MNSFEDMSVKELKDYARSKKYKGWTSLRKKDLIDYLRDREAEANQDEDNSDKKENVNFLKEDKDYEEEKKSEVEGDIIEEDQGEEGEREDEKETFEAGQPSENEVSGILEILQDGYGFLRGNGYSSGDDDVYVSPVHIRRFHLKEGDFIDGISKENNDGGKYGPLIYINRINGGSPKRMWERKNFEDLTPIYPDQRIRMETDQDNFTSRLIDLVAPIGKGQRGLIVSPPKAGKTTLIKSIANAIERNHPEIHVIVLLIDERPEEVTDMKRSVRGEVVASTFDESPENHIHLSEFVLERAKRLVETDKDVIILLDSLTRLSRAYNLECPPSGKTLSGGLDPTALYQPKKFFGAARNIEGGGSLTILASALIDTGSRMDDVIYEEFKGTGNMEIILDRHLSELRIFPAIDIFKSGTRKEELLLSEEEEKCMLALRYYKESASNMDFLEILRKLLKETADNEELVSFVNRQYNKNKI